MGRFDARFAKALTAWWRCSDGGLTLERRRSERRGRRSRYASCPLFGRMSLMGRTMVLGVLAFLCSGLEIASAQPPARAFMDAVRGRADEQTRGEDCDGGRAEPRRVAG